MFGYRIARLDTPGFFITAECVQQSDSMPETIESFVFERMQWIANRATARKFAYKEKGRRLTFTFFPTDRVVEEKYALKNRCLKK